MHIHVDPVLKQFYELFTYGKNGQKLRQIKSYLANYEYIKSVVDSFKEQDCKCVAIGQISRMVIDENGKGYANIVGKICYGNAVYDKDGTLIEPAYSHDYEYFTDLGIVVNGTLHTWYPYGNMAFKDNDDNPYVLKPQINDTYVARKAFDFASPLTTDFDILNRIGMAYPNGCYTSPELEKFSNDVASYIAEVDGLETEYWNKKMETDTPQNISEVLDAMGIDVHNDEDLNPSTPQIDTSNVIDAEFSVSTATDNSTQEVTDVETLIDAVIEDLEAEAVSEVVVEDAIIEKVAPKKPVGRRSSKK